MTLSRIFLLGILLFCLGSFPAIAEEKKEKEKYAKATPITEWIDSENHLLGTLQRKGQEVFFVLRNKHSVIRTIRVVRRDVKNAVKACGKNNKELKASMETRFKEWESAILPILDTAEKFLKTELKEQEVFHVSDYDHVMKLNDDAYKFSESKIQKSPVTTKEACEGLLKSMNTTEDKLVGLLQEVLLPQEVVRKRAERIEAAKKEAKKKAKEKSEEKAKEDKK